MNSRISSKTKVAVFGSLRVMVISALLAALSIVCGKLLSIPAGPFMRFGFENLPILFAGILFGPVIGAIVGLVADLIGCVLAGYTINPLITLGFVAIGLISGILWKLSCRLPLWLRLLLAVGVAHLIGSVILKTIGLHAFYSVKYQTPIWQLALWRLFNYLIVGPMDFAVLYIILKTPATRNFFEKMAVIRQRKQ